MKTVSVNPLYLRPENTDLSNWRLSPYSNWAFQNVRELIPTANIPAGIDSVPIPGEAAEIGSEFDHLNAGAGGFSEYLTKTHTDCLLVLKAGRKIRLWQAPHCDVTKPHIVFSISKSITAMLVGILVDQNLIDVSKPVSFYLPGTRGSAYEDATVQHLLDMTVALDFEESYLDTTGGFQRYRNATCWNPVDQNDPGPSLEAFLYGLGRLDEDHGRLFRYRSPNTDLLGVLIERVSGLSYARLLSELIWQPMGARTDGYVTVDRNGLARAAGGVCITVEDLARFGNLILNHGTIVGRSVIPERWIEQTLNGGDRLAWQAGDMSYILPDGRYHNKWYQVGNSDRCFMGLGIHGQWLFINPATDVVIVKFSSQPLPLDDPLDIEWAKLLSRLSHEI